MFFNIGPFEILALIVLGIVLFGPDKLPSAAVNAARVLRQFRQFAQNARADLGRELGPEFEGLSLEDLNPRTFVRKNLMGDGEDQFGLRELRELREDISLDLDDGAARTATRVEDVAPRIPQQPRIAPGERPPFDADAT